MQKRISSFVISKGRQIKTAEFAGPRICRLRTAYHLSGNNLAGSCIPEPWLRPLRNVYFRIWEACAHNVLARTGYSKVFDPGRVLARYHAYNELEDTHIKFGV